MMTYIVRRYLVFLIREIDRLIHQTKKSTTLHRGKFHLFDVSGKFLSAHFGISGITRPERRVNIT